MSGRFDRDHRVDPEAGRQDRAIDDEQVAGVPRLAARVADRSSRELPMCAVPIRWNEPRVTWAGPQP